MDYSDRKVFFRKLLLIAIPIILQNGITNFVGLLDNIMVGRVGTAPMSGVAIINQLLFVLNLTLFGASAGTGIFTSQFYGRGNEDGIRQTVRFKLLATVGLTVLAIVILLTFGDGLTEAWLHDDNAADLAVTRQSARDYLTVMLFGLLPFAVKESYGSTLRETGQTAVPMWAAFVAVAVNLFGNYILIFGKLGAPVLGVTGAAIATVVSRFVECAIVVVYTHRRTDRNPYAVGLYRSFRIGRQLVNDVVHKAMPLILNEVLWSAAISMLSRFYSERGLGAVAAANIASAVTNVTSVVFIAIGITAGIVMGNLLGAGKLEDARRSAIPISLFGAGLAVCVGALEALSSGLFPLVYNTTDEIRHQASTLILIHGCAQPLLAISVCEYYIIRSGGSVLVTMLTDGLYEWMASVPVAAILAFFTDVPLTVIYGGVLLMQSLKMLPAFIVMKRGKWIRNLADKYDR